MQSKKLADGEKKDLGASIVRENEKAANDAIQEAVGLMQQIYDKTNKHYRVYFEDELEHNKEIFDKEIFYTANIQRG